MFTQDPPDNPLIRASSILFEAAKQISDCFGLDGDRVHKAVIRVVVTFGPGLLTQPEELPAALYRFPFSLLSEALRSLPPLKAIELIETDDLVMLADRILLTEYFIRQQLPLYTLDELADRTDKFIDYLERDRGFLVETGLPRRFANECPWHYRYLSRLYDTRVTSSPYPAEKLGKKEALGPYEWLRKSIPQRQLPSLEVINRTVEESPPTEREDTESPPPVYPLDAAIEAAIEAFNVPSAWVESYERCMKYTDASFLPLQGMQEHEFHDLESLRGKFLNLKIAVLRVLAKAAKIKDGQGLWNKVLMELDRHLTVDEVKFLLNADRSYLGFDVRTEEGWHADREMIPGGLSNLLEVVGHFEQELTIGVMKQIRSILGDLGVDPESSNLRAFDYRGRYAYFSFVGRQERYRLDAALDLKLDLQEREQAFWRDYRERFAESLRSDFVVTIPIYMRAKNVPALQAYLQHEADLRSRVWENGVQNIFQRKGRFWQIKFEGGDQFALPESPGLFIIAFLLARPGKAISAVELRRENDRFSAPAVRDHGQIHAEKQILNEHRALDSGEILDDEGLEQSREEYERLEEELGEAERSDNQAEMSRIQEEKRKLAEYLVNAKTPDGSKTVVASRLKRDRDMVRSAIDRALGQIKESQ